VLLSAGATEKGSLYRVIQVFWTTPDRIREKVGIVRFQNRGSEKKMLHHSRGEASPAPRCPIAVRWKVKGQKGRYFREKAA
jgi:hypothetical protein